MALNSYKITYLLNQKEHVAWIMETSRIAAEQKLQNQYPLAIQTNVVAYINTRNLKEVK